jgi:hypothetical protein
MVWQGKTFNKKYNGKIFIKLTSFTENHNGFQFQTGLNIDKNKFIPKPGHQQGGILFCEFENFPRWIQYGYSEMYYIRIVTIPEDAKICFEQYEIEVRQIGFGSVRTPLFKTNKLILSDRRKISDIEEWNNKNFCLNAVKQNGLALRYIKNQTLNICLFAVKNFGYAFHYIKDIKDGGPGKTEELLAAAITKNPRIFESLGKTVKFGNHELSLENFKQTPALCLAVVKSSGSHLKYVENQTDEVCLEAIKQDPAAIMFVNHNKYKYGLYAVKIHQDALNWIFDQTEELCLEAIKHFPNALSYVKVRTQAICDLYNLSIK